MSNRDGIRTKASRQRSGARAGAAGCASTARLMRLDRPIGIWLLLWPMLWALWISRERPAGRADVRGVRHRHVRDALGRLRDERFRRPQLRSARATHGGPATRQAVASRRPKRWRCSRVLGTAGARAADHAQPADAGAGVDRRRAGRDLSVPEALLPAAAVLPRRSRSAGPCRWRSPRTTRRRAGALGWLLFVVGRCCGDGCTTRSTRWSIATTTSRSAFARRRSCSAGRIAASWRSTVELAGRARARRAHGRARPLVLGRARVAAAPRRPPAGADPHTRPCDRFRAFLNNNLFGLAVFAGSCSITCSRADARRVAGPRRYRVQGVAQGLLQRPFGSTKCSTT